MRLYRPHCGKLGSQKEMSIRVTVGASSWEDGNAPTVISRSGANTDLIGPMKK